MFWNLNRNSREPDMRELSQLFVDFFSYAAAQRGTTLDAPALCKAFPQNAQWLLEQFHGQYENRKKLQEAVYELFLLPPVRRRAIAHAVANDMSFDTAPDPSRFFFAVPALPPQEQSIVEEFFKYFYETAFMRKRGPTINGSVSGATRTEFTKAYYQANDSILHACPICLCPMSNVVKENELEHYFPKSVYAPLYLHPSNLIFICPSCNRAYKKADDILHMGKRPLSSVFLPYRDTVKEHTKVVFRRNANRDCVKLLAADGSADKKKKISNFNQLYHLEERWSFDLERIFEQLRKTCAGQNWSKEEVRRRLKENCETLQALTEFPDKFLEREYLSWLYETMFDAFYDSL